MQLKKKQQLAKGTSRISLMILLFISITSSGIVIAQKYKPFTGMFEYKISARDTSMKDYLPNYPMMVYTNDTIVRTENFTSNLGVQVVIRHIEKNKSYLLLNTRIGKFAIQTDHSVKPEKIDTTNSGKKFTFKKKCFKRKILGRKANRIHAYHPDMEEPIEFLYFKKVSHEYNNIYEEIPGLPVRYSVVTADGILDYELVKINEYNTNRDLFGIPSDYERVSFDEFLDRMLAPENQQTISPE